MLSAYKYKQKKQKTRLWVVCAKRDSFFFGGGAKKKNPMNSGSKLHHGDGRVGVARNYAGGVLPCVAAGSGARSPKLKGLPSRASTQTSAAGQTRRGNWDAASQKPAEIIARDSAAPQKSTSHAAPASEIRSGDMPHRLLGSHTGVSPTKVHLQDDTFEIGQ